MVNKTQKTQMTQKAKKTCNSGGVGGRDKGAKNFWSVCWKLICILHWTMDILDNGNSIGDRRMLFIPEYWLVWSWWSREHWSEGQHWTVTRPWPRQPPPRQPPASFQATEAANFAFIYCFMPTFDRPALPRRANTSIIVWICEHENNRYQYFDTFIDR